MTSTIEQTAGAEYEESQSAGEPVGEFKLPPIALGELAVNINKNMGIVSEKRTGDFISTD